MPALLAAALVCACGPASERGQVLDASRAAGTTACPARTRMTGLPPGTRPEHMQLGYWLRRYQPSDLDAPLLSVDEVQGYDRAFGRSGQAPYSQRDLLQANGRASLQRELDERLDYMRVRLSDGRYVRSDGSPLPTSALASFNARLPELAPELRVALSVVPIRCGPYVSGLFERKPGTPLSVIYDRNACSSAREQEVVQVLATWPDASLLVRTRFALGWIAADAPLSPPIPEALQPAFVRGPRLRAASPITLASSGRRHALPKHASIPSQTNGRALVADERGFQELEARGLESTRRPLTRRALLTTAFQFLDSPYGFGDADGGRDCSRLQMDLFESFDIALPRHSSWQAQTGTFALDLAGMNVADKLSAIDRAAANAIVLLALPGHIMLYLGKDQAGVPMALHALGEYARPCGDGHGETIVDVQRTMVSDLQLGAGSSRTSLIERVTALAGFGADPPPELTPIARLRALPPEGPPAQCRDSVDARIFASPARPKAGQPLRFIATAAEAGASAALWVFGPRGELEAGDAHRLSGPPQGLWTRIEDAQRGRYTAVLMDGARVLGCKRVVAQSESAAPSEASDTMVWTPRVRWEQDTLGLWSAFVEQLFDGAPDDEQTWTNLQTLLRDPERNLLLNHLGLNEDAAIAIEPDCADLPFALRGYFAWKLRLPFGYRQCSRGRPGVPPRCSALNTNLVERDAVETRAGQGTVATFAAFLNRKVRDSVHSGSGRTHPEDSETDLYPVALQRPSLAPGTVYADPYGHVLLIAKWFPQGKAPDAYGILIGAEAQPDGTIGRRRFFQGSFLFDPATTDSGAGFKQFRPLVYDAKTASIAALDNTELAKSSAFPRFSLQQYAGSKDDFYENMDRLINPAPLDPHVRLKSLIDALDEAARRRVLALDNGEQYFAKGGRGPIAMPSGYEIFETQGAWEDFATPSRDMRLLIAIDTVLALPAQVARYPDRFKLPAAQAREASDQVRLETERALAARTFSYTRSDGKPQLLSLKDARDRAGRLEVAYNPNDCVELRWGAQEGSEELASCRRRAPPEQRARMERYRSWFHQRTRPIRGTRQ